MPKYLLLVLLVSHISYSIAGPFDFLEKISNIFKGKSHTEEELITSSKGSAVRRGLKNALKVAIPLTLITGSVSLGLGLMYKSNSSNLNISNINGTSLNRDNVTNFNGDNGITLIKKVANVRNTNRIFTISNGTLRVESHAIPPKTSESAFHRVVKKLEALFTYQFATYFIIISSIWTVLILCLALDIRGRFRKLTTPDAQENTAPEGNVQDPLGKNYGNTPLIDENQMAMINM